MNYNNSVVEAENNEVMIKKGKSKKPLIFVVLVLIVAAILFFAFQEREPVAQVHGNETTVAVKDYIVAENENSFYIIDAGSEDKKPLFIDEKTGSVPYREYFFNKEQTGLLYINNVEETESDELLYELWLYDIEANTKTMLAQNVTQFIPDKAFSSILYVGTDGILYYKTVNGDAQKIAEKCGCFDASEDLQTVIYGDFYGRYYMHKIGGDTQLLSEKQIELQSISDDFNEVVYLEDDCIIRQKGDKKEVLLDAYEAEYGVLISQGEYFVSFGERIDITECLVDDMLEEDRKNSNSKDNGRLARENLRQEIKNNPIDISFYNLYYYNGETVEVILENVVYSLSDNNLYYSDEESEIGVHCVVREYDLPKIKMSEIDDLFIRDTVSLRNYVYNKISQKGEICVTKKDAVLGYIFLESPQMYLYDKEKTMLYIQTAQYREDEVTESYNYYSVELKENTLEELDIIAEDIKTNENIFSLCCGKLLYSQDNEDGVTFSLYADGEKIVPNAGYSEQFTSNAMYIYNSSEDIEGDEKNLLYIDGDIIELEGVDNYNGYVFTKKENLICFDGYEGSLAVAQKNGKVTIVDGEFSNVVFPEETYAFN